MPRSFSRQEKASRVAKKEQKQSHVYIKPASKAQRLNQLQAQIDFINSLPTFFAAAWNSTTANRAWDEPPNAVKPCHFLRLPPELRSIIYEFVLKKPNIIHLRRRWRTWESLPYESSTQFPLSVGPALLRVSRDIRREAVPVYFRSNKFMIHLYGSGHSSALSWIESTIERYGPKPFGDLRFLFCNFPWSEFPQTERLVRLLASGKLALDVSGIDVAAPGGRPPSLQAHRLITIKDMQGGKNAQRALEEAIVLGTTARDQRWSDRHLSFQFRVLVALKMPRKQLYEYKQVHKVRERKRLKRERKEMRRESRIGGV